jgi:drug/metabolite transporter (DMT)-like permease
MSWQLAALLTVSSVLACVGQVLFKYASTGRATLLEQLNAPLLAGFGCYAAGAVLWIYCMARVPLLKVYPFTSLTLVLTIVAGVVLFHETAAVSYWIGIGFILTGLLLVSL